MQRRTAWPDDVNIIEFDPASAALAAQLEQAGFRRYLAVTTSDRAARRVAGDARFAGRTVHVGGRGCIRHNNADVLTMSPGLLDRYLVAAAKISRMVARDEQVRPSVSSYTLPYLSLGQDDQMSTEAIAMAYLMRGVHF